MRYSNTKSEILAVVVVMLMSTAICNAVPYVETWDSAEVVWGMTDSYGNTPSDLTTLGGSFGWDAGGGKLLKYN